MRGFGTSYSERAQETILRFLEHMLEINLSGVSAKFTTSPFYQLAKRCKWMLFFPLYEESLDESMNSQATDDGKTHFQVVSQRIAVLEAVRSILLGTCQISKLNGNFLQQPFTAHSVTSHRSPGH